MIEHNRIKVAKQADNYIGSAFEEGVLYLVATPIGNLQDITIRALQILRDVHIVFCEDTRVTSKLLSYYGIKKKLLVYNDHSSQIEREKVLSHLQHGESIALVSDAGSPLIADPGYKLIRYLQANNANIKVVPGPCSAVAALTASGISSHRFIFYGFLSKKQQARRKEIESLRQIDATSVFLVQSMGLLETLQEMQEILGERAASVSRELTKIYEETIFSSLSDLYNYYQRHLPKGEIVLVLEGAKESLPIEEDIIKLLDVLLRKVSLKTAVQEVAEVFNLSKNLSKKDIYQLALKVAQEIAREESLKSFSSCYIKREAKQGLLRP